MPVFFSFLANLLSSFFESGFFSPPSSAGASPFADLSFLPPAAPFARSLASI